MFARIFSPARNAMQSGKAKAGRWILEFDSEKPKQIEPLMGYTSSADTQSQVKLEFATLEDATAYAVRHGFSYTVLESHKPKRRKMAYADNFSYDRRIPWTH